MNKLRIAIDCDDAAIELKRSIIDYCLHKGYDITDLNQMKSENVSYPEIALNLATKVSNHEYDRGILLCGTGIGMSMVANKVQGAYAGLCHDVYSAERLRKSNDGNILTMGARVIGPEHAKYIVAAFLNSEFQEGGSSQKVRKLREIESSQFKKK